MWEAGKERNFGRRESKNGRRREMRKRGKEGMQREKEKRRVRNYLA